MSDVADVLRPRSEAMPELEVIQDQRRLWVALVLLPCIEASFEEFALVQVLEEFFVVHEWIELVHKPLNLFW